MNEPELTTRREFLHKGLSLICVGATVPTFLQRSALALDDPRDVRLTRSRPGVPEDRILVVVQLAGGNDGLNTLVPFHSDAYYRARPTLAIPADQVIKLDAELGFHPAAVGLKSLYDDGHLCVVQQVGYPNPNRSHFRSMDIWHTASPDGRLHEGWIGRYFDNCCRGEPDPKAGIALTAEAPLALRGQKFAPIAFSRPEMLNLRPVDGRMATRSAIASLNRPDAERKDGPPVSTLDFLTRTALDAQVAADDIRRAAARDDGARFPESQLSQSLRTVSRLIAANLPTRVYFVSLSGFDTHARQANRHRQLLEQLGQALQAFIQALAKQGNLGRTLVMTFSEFGRRVAENGSAGTDHGEAAPMFLLGGDVRAGLCGPTPQLENLNRGDLPFAIDFRQVYAAVLSDWLGADATRLLGGRFDPPDIFRATP